jgi:hypothetical protein
VLSIAILFSHLEAFLTYVILATTASLLIAERGRVPVLRARGLGRHRASARCVARRVSLLPLLAVVCRDRGVYVAPPGRAAGGPSQ